MEEIKVGEYVRTNKDNIGKVIGIFNGHCLAKYHIEFQGNVKVKRQYLSIKTIVKHSLSIIDLVEKGDYVNGEEVTKIKEWKSSKDGYFRYAVTVSCNVIRPDEIKSIVTKEQFEQMKYIVEDE